MTWWTSLFEDVCPPCSTPCTARKGRVLSADEKRVFLFGVAPVPGAHFPEAAQRAEGGLDRRHHGQAFAGGRNDGLLQDDGGLIHAPGQIRNQPVDLLRLRRGQRDGPRCFLGEGLGASNQRPHFLMYGLDRLLRLLRETKRRKDRPH